MKTADVKALALEVLATLPKPYSEHVIDDVFGAIAGNPDWLARYQQLRGELTPTVANTWLGHWIANALGKVGERQVPSRASRLIRSYSILDTDARAITRKPKEDEARQMMWDFYRVHKDELPAEIRQHRELIVALIIEGLTAAQAFQQVLPG